MADVVPLNFSDNTEPVYDAGAQGSPEQTLQFDFSNETELQNYTDDEAEATNIANNRLGFRMDAKYRWDLHNYRSMQEDLSWQILRGEIDKDRAKALLDSRQLEIQQKYGLSSFNSEETSPYAFKIGKFNFDVGGSIDQVFQQGDILQEMFTPKSIPIGLLSYGVRFTQNQKITAAGAAVGSAAPGVGTAAGAATGETVAVVKSSIEALNDVRNSAVFFDTASKEGSDFFYQAYVENGLPMEEARNAAVVVGLVNGAMEVWSQDILAAPFKKAGGLIAKSAEKKMAQTVTKAMAKAVKNQVFKEGVKAFGKQFGSTVASETITEVLQTTTQIAAEIQTGQLDLSDEAQRRAAIDRLIQTGMSAAAATLVLGSISGGVEVNNKRIEIARQSINGPVVEKEVSAIILSPDEATQAEAEIAQGQITGEKGTEGTTQKAPTTEQSETVAPKMKAEEKLIRNKRLSTLDRTIKDTDKKISQAEKQFNEAKNAGKSTRAIEKRLDDLYDTKEKAQSEKSDIETGKKSIKDIAREEVKITPDETLKMRKAKISEELSQAKSDLKTANAELRIAKLGNKNTTRALEKVAKLEEKIDALNNEKAMIESGGLVKEDYRLPEAPTKGTVNLDNYRKQKVRELSNAVDNYVKGVREGASQQRKETKAVQNAIQKLIADAGVRVQERGQFASLIRDTQTVEQLAANKGKLIDKVKQVFENRNKKAAIAKLNDFKKTVKKANIDADVRNRMNYLLGLTKMNDFDSGLRQQELETRLENGETLSEAETKLLADLQLASGIRDAKGRVIRSAKEINMLNEELQRLLDTGRTKRQEYLEQVRQDKIDKINGAIDAITNAKFGNNMVMDWFNRSIANIGTILNVIGGKEFKEKYDPEFQQGRYNQAMYAKSKAIKHEGMKLFKADQYQLEKVFRDMAKEDFFITLQQESEIKNIPTKISKWHIIDIYNSIKNEDIAQNYFDAYGQDQIMSLVSNLSDAEMKFADYMQSVVQDYYSVANEYNKRKTGKELEKRPNYWMATSNMMEEEYNALDTYRPASSVPSFLKKKAKKTTPIPKNAMQKMSKHIRQAEYIQHMEPTYLDLKNIFGDRNVCNLVTQKYGSKLMDLINKEVDTLSMSYHREAANAFERVFNKLIGNWAVAKVANPIVGIKQIAASVNYATEMPVAAWTKNFTKALAHPKKTFDFMIKNSPMLETRYGQGYDDAISLAISGAEGSSKAQQILTESLLSFTKMGDIAAIIYGGNAFVQYRIDQGDSIEVAFEKFEKITNKTQQSNNPSSLSQLQKSRGFGFFMKFRNTPNQYARLIVENQLQYMRGEISQLEYAKTMVMYTMIQPLLYTYIGAAAKDIGGSLTAMIGGGSDDDKKEVTKLETFLDAMNMMLTSTVDALPILDEVVDRALRDFETFALRQAGVTIDMPKFDMFQAQMLADMYKGYMKLDSQLSKIGKEDSDFNLAKAIYGFGLMQEPMTKIPVKPLFAITNALSGGALYDYMDKRKEKRYNKRKKKENDAYEFSGSEGYEFSEG